MTGAKKAYLAVLSECRDFRVFELERDEEEIKALMDAEREFWNTYVLTKKTPPVDGHSATGEAIKKMFDIDDGSTADLSGLEHVFDQRKSLIAHQKAVKSQIDELDNSIKLAMKNDSEGSCGGFRVSWKVQTTSGIDREAIKRDYPEIDFSKYATQSRVFRVTEKKQKTA